MGKTIPQIPRGILGIYFAVENVLNKGSILPTHWPKEQMHRHTELGTKDAIQLITKKLHQTSPENSSKSYAQLLYSMPVVLNPNCFATRFFHIFFSTTQIEGQFFFILLLKVGKSSARDPFKICHDPLPGRDPSVEKRCSRQRLYL